MKHALNAYNFIKVSKEKNISPYDYLRLKMYDECSAEMEAIFSFINNREMVKKYIPIPIEYIEYYPNIVNYIKTHENYYNNLPEFVKIVKKDLEEIFLPLYKKEYYLELTTDRIGQFPNEFSNKSDSDSYNIIKKEMLTFEIFNPNTRKDELIDLSSYFDDYEISSKDKYIITKKYRKAKNLKRELENTTKLSNKTLKILNNELSR